MSGKKRKNKIPKSSLEKQRQRDDFFQRIEWLKWQFMRLFCDNTNLRKDMGRWATKHDKEIKRTLLIVVIVGTILFALGFVADSFLSSVTVYRNGIPISGPGAE